MEMRQNTVHYNPDTQVPDEKPVSLFDDWDDKGFVESDVAQLEFLGPVSEGLVVNRVRTARHLGKNALVSAEKGREAPRLLPIESVLDEISTQRDKDSIKPDIYGDLGGGLQAYRLAEYGPRQGFIAPLDSYKDWHKETRQAVEQYRLWDMGVDDFNSMTVVDRSKLSLHVFGYVEGVKGAKRLIEAYQGQSPRGSHIDRWYGQGHTPLELLGYASTLGLLAEGIESTGIASKARELLEVPSQSSGWYQSKRNKVLHRYSQDVAKNGAVQVIFDKGRFRLDR